MTTAELIDLFDIEFAEKVAKDIVTAFQIKATNENLELEFRIPAGQGRMDGSLDSPNTWFKFDPDIGSYLEHAKNVIADVFAEDFDLTNKEESSRMDERRNIIDGFRDQVRLILNSGQFHQEIAGTIRRVCLQNVSEDIHPLDVIRFIEIEIGESDPDEFLLVIEKKAMVDPTTGNFINHPVSIHEELYKLHQETGKDFNEIIQERKKMGDERFALVTGAKTKRYSFEVHCEMAVDYSLAERSDVPKPRLAQT